jgi:hypothetical protein
LDGLVGRPDVRTKRLVGGLGKPPEHTHMRSQTNLAKGRDLVNQQVISSMGEETQQMGAYKGTRAHNQEGNLEDKESKKTLWF